MTAPALVVLLAQLPSCHQTPADCATLTQSGQWASAVEACESEYKRTGDPAVGLLLAKALQFTGNESRIAELANRLLATRFRADALTLLGRSAARHGHQDDAKAKLAEAAGLHAAAGELGKLASDEQALAGVSVWADHFAEALRVLDDCIAHAHAGAAPTVEGYCHLSAAQVLAQVGHGEAAQREFDRATALLTSARDRVQVDLARGNILQELGHDRQAVVSFEHALALAEQENFTAAAVSAHLNLAYSLAEIGRPDDAAQHLAAAPPGKDLSATSQRLLLAGRIAWRRGQFGFARSLLPVAMATAGDDDDRIEIAVLQARVALALGDHEGAEAAARQGVGHAESLRSAQRAIELRPWVLSARRTPYELLFSALASAGRTADAFVVFDQWQGRALLDGLARSEAGGTAFDLRKVALRTEAMRSLLPVLSDAPAVQPPRPADLTAALDSSDILALAVANEELWRLTAHHGELQAVDLGRFAALKQQLDELTVNPTNLALADRLGTLLVPEAMFRDTREVLYVTLDGKLGSLPVSALRRSGKPLAAARPVLRTPRIARPECSATGARQPGAVVISDVRGDLPAAQQEGAEAARMLGTTNLTGAEATSDALFGAAHRTVLHLAMHADVELAGGELQLYDRAVPALEVSARGLGPLLVVLSACSSAEASDLEGASSLALSFLAGGSRYVVATLRPINDANSLALMTEFYRLGGVEDPVRVLAAAQASLAGTSKATDWAKFAIFGHNACPITH